jgi:hypothetical protein
MAGDLLASGRYETHHPGPISEGSPTPQAVAMPEGGRPRELPGVAASLAKADADAACPIR